MFPILNSYGDCIGFTARTLDPNSKFAKYKNSTQTLIFDKSRTIYNINSIKQLKKEQKIDYIIICEGTIDVIAMYKAGFRNTVACMGTAITNFHATQLKRYSDKIILCLDGDDAGQNATYKAIDVLSEQGLEVKVVKLKDNLDPDEFLKKYGAEELKNALLNAEDCIEYKLTSLASKYNLTDSYQKNKYITNALEIISKLDSNAEKEIYLKVLSKRVYISVDVLRRDLSGKPLTKTANPLTAEVSPEKPFVVRQEGNTKATKFIIASIVHKKPYAIEDIKKNFKFKNSAYQNLYDFVARCDSEGKTYTISSLFDYFDVDNNPDIKEIIDFNFAEYDGSAENYYNECTKKGDLPALEQQKKELLKLFSQARENSEKTEILRNIQEIDKKINKIKDKKQ